MELELVAATDFEYQHRVFGAIFVFEYYSDQPLWKIPGKFEKFCAQE